MTQIINPQGYIEEEENGGRVSLVSSDTTNAQIDQQGYFYKEENVGGVLGRIPVVAVEGNDNNSREIPSLQQVTDVDNITTNPIAAGLAITDDQLPSLGQAKSIFTPRADKNSDGSIYTYNNVLMWSKPKASTGAIKIVLPNKEEDMGYLQFEIDVNFFNQSLLKNCGVKIFISSHYSGAPWAKSFVFVLGLSTFSIRLAKDYSTGKLCILLGNTGFYWYDPSIIIKSVNVSNLGQSLWGEGYSASIITSETGITNVVSPQVLGYEEGSWTPSLEGLTTAGIANYTTRVAQYIKIGRKVTISLNIVGSFTTAPTGQAIIRGLPFTSDGNTPIVCSLQSSYTVNTISAVIGAGANTYIGLGVIPSDITSVLGNAVFGMAISNSVFNIRLSATYISTI